ncbi:MAG: I78 family peptidase inhibitor [Pseudomonadota bacterium]|nr:I78 family peptidase inhibitor [Pseudomonadota bacterium]
MKIMMAGLMAATTAACAPVPPAAPLPVEPEGGVCSIDRASALIGRAASVELGAEALRLTGGRTIRWIQPGQAVTMDYRPDRLNIELDAQNRVVRFGCN